MSEIKKLKAQYKKEMHTEEFKQERTKLVQSILQHDTPNCGGIKINMKNL